MDRIYIHEREGKSRNIPRKMDIHLRFVGNISIPIDESDLQDEPTAEELAKIEQRRIRANERCRAYREKKKAKLAEEKAAAKKEKLITVVNTDNPKPVA